MRILHILNHTRKNNGHVHAAIDLACAQIALGHEVAIASSGGDFHNILEKNSISHIQLELSRRPGSMLKTMLKLLNIVNKFDIIHGHMVLSALLSVIACKINKIPLVTTIHNEFNREAFLMGIGTRVIAVSEAVAQSMERRGIPKKRLRTVLNGTIGTSRCTGSIGISAIIKSPSILFVGGLHPRKGVLDLIKAFIVVSEYFPEVTLHIVGEGPHKNEYKKVASASPCALSILFHGGQDDTRPWFRDADIFILPSISEPAGLVLSEACEGGCAIIATNVGGIPEMLNNGAAGMLVGPGNPLELSRAILSLLNDPVRLRNAKHASEENIKRMLISRVAEETLDVYNELL